MPESIAIVGPESTGKSMLAKLLSNHYKGIWVPEYARTYLQTSQGKYGLHDVERIAAEQFRQIFVAQNNPSHISFADTEMLVCHIWCKVVFGTVPQTIEKLLDQQRFDYYLLCDIDLAWQPDPLREHPNRRQEIFDMYHEALLQRRLPFTIVRGQGAVRTQNAIHAIDRILIRQT